MTTVQRLTGDSVNNLTAAVVFLFTLAVYTITMTPTVPFWDSGEYIATSYILGIPHPPGTPLFVLVGRMFTLIPIGNIAERVNWFSGFASAVTILLTYLITVKFTRKLFPWDSGEMNRPLAYLAGVVAAFMAAFATTFWDNAIEAEVYAAACAIMTFCVWLILRWEERLDEGTEDGLLLVITYMVALGVGIHLGVAISAWATVAFVFACRPHYLKNWNYLGWAIVTLSLGVGINTMTFLWAPIVLGITLVMWLFTGKVKKLALWSSILFMFGISVHAYLIIRANLDPAINEGAPKDWEALWLLLTRDQYKPGSPFDRRAPVSFQISEMWLRYMWWNFTLFTAKGRDFFQLPVILAVVGAVIHMLREKRSAVILVTLFLFLGPAMVFYLNFREGEVRERDYFFVQNFQFMAIWVGIGTAWFVEAVRRQFASASLRRITTGVGVCVFSAMSLLPLVHNWFAHNRSGFHLAYNYAHNMLAGLERDAIIFTNGDNDTFPLWYIQEVEEFRSDVRVVNLSLLNTTWYIQQLRDQEPRVPIRWTDDQIETLYEALPWVHAQAIGRAVGASDRFSRAWDRDALQEILDVLIAVRNSNGEREYSVKEVGVAHIIGQNAGRKPVYVAVSVPDRMGMDSLMSMEGLAFRVYGEPPPMSTNVERLEENLHDLFRYEGFVRPVPDRPEGSIGEYDDSVYKGTGPSRMAENNHAAAFARLSLEYLRRESDFDRALVEIRNASAIAPQFAGTAVTEGYILENTGKWEEAEQHYRESLERHPDNWQFANRLGATLLQRKEPGEAIPYYQQAMGLAPREFEPIRGLASAYYNMGMLERAKAVLTAWLDRNPGDEQAGAMLRSLDAPPDTTAGAGAAGN